MSNFTHIYKKNESEIKLLDTLNYTLDEFKSNPQGCFPSWDTATMIASEVKYEYPVLDSKTKELREKTKYEKYKSGEYELQQNEVEFKEDILVLNPGQYIKDNEVVTVPKPEGTKIEWDWNLHEWQEKATTLEVVQAQYREYEDMDTPSTLEEMKQQDPAMATEYINMMIELRGLIYTLSASEAQPVGYSALPIPLPSQALKNFKNKFKKI